MTFTPNCNLIICEQTNRWVSAVRLVFERDVSGDEANCRIRETRVLDELTTELAGRPASIAAIEIRDGNLDEVLAWIANAQHRFPQARAIALLDRSLTTTRQGVRPSEEQSARDVCNALYEAGATEVIESPRRLQPLLELVRRHMNIASRREAELAENLPLTDRLWSTLPWQDA